jgi:hypothetical protein
MTQQLIIVGTPNSREGDSLFAAFTKINENFTDLYNTTGADAPANKLVNGASEVVLDEGGMLTVPGTIAFQDGIITGNDNTDPGMVLGSSNKSVFVSTLSGIDQYKWRFGTDGTLAIPGGSWTKTTNNNLASTVLTQVVWTSTVDYISGAKLTIQVEADETGGSGNWETQLCEAIIAVRGYTNISQPVMTVYGVTHTSIAPLMTFTVDRNPTTNLIEIVGTRTGTASSLGNASLRIYSVETGTND